MDARTPHASPISCPGCGGDSWEAYRVIPNHDSATRAFVPDIAIALCRGCGLAHQNPCVRPEVLRSFYEEHEDKISLPPSGESVTEGEAQARVRALARHVPAGARLLEIGCSDGAFLAAARTAGYQAAGIDLSGPNIAKARAAHPGLNVRRAALEDLPHSPDFDAVCHFFVLEHVFDPIAFLKECARRLKPGGILFFEVPDLDIFARLPFINYLFPYQHTCHFSPRTIQGALARTGLEAVAVESGPGSASKSYGMRVAARRGARPATPSRNPDLGAERSALDAYFSGRERLVRELGLRAKSWVAQAGPGPVVVFGAGENGRVLVVEAGLKAAPLYFCDNSRTLQGQSVEGIEVLDPARIPSLSPALVIVASIDYQDDMCRQLKSLGVPDARVRRLYNGL